MQVIYFGTDEVNLDLADRVARECGASLVPSRGRDRPEGGGASAVIYELDHLASRDRDEVVRGLLERPSPAAAAVHGYDLADEQMAALGARGIIVSRRFEPDVIRRFCHEASTRTAPADGHPPDSEGASADPAELCASVRRLASRAHGALKGISGGPGGDGDGVARDLDRWLQEAARLRRQIDQLRRLHALRLDELQRWLGRLRELVEARRQA